MLRANDGMVDSQPISRRLEKHMRNRQRRKLHKCTCAACQQHPYGRIAQDQRAINRVMANLNEKNRRRFAGVLVQQWGHGGIQRVIEITGLSRNTICRGQQEAQHAEGASEKARIRQVGGGRKLVEKNIRAWKTN